MKDDMDISTPISAAGTMEIPALTYSTSTEEIRNKEEMKSALITAPAVLPAPEVDETNVNIEYLDWSWNARRTQIRKLVKQWSELTSADH